MRRRMLVAAAMFAASIHAVPALAQNAPGTTFRDCADCPELVVVAGGRFLMGAAPGEEEREGAPESYRGRSQPRVSVSVESFMLGRYEVTRGEFAAFVAETGRATQGNCWYWDFSDSKAKNDDPAKNWRNPGFPQTNRHPVVCVDWNDAQAYVAWLGRKTGKAYRLPSEAEWEYAARAGTRTTRPWGNAAGGACDHANVWDESAKGTYSNAINLHPCSDGFVRTAPAGSFQPNRFGLYDVIGNVLEWVEDCWNGTLAEMPANGAARLSGDCSRRVGRGGSWADDPGLARPASRGRNGTGDRSDFLGFRVARTR